MQRAGHVNQARVCQLLERERGLLTTTRLLPLLRSYVNITGSQHSIFPQLAFPFIFYLLFTPKFPYIWSVFENVCKYCVLCYIKDTSHSDCNCCDVEIELFQIEWNGTVYSRDYGWVGPLSPYISLFRSCQDVRFSLPSSSNISDFPSNTGLLYILYILYIYIT